MDLHERLIAARIHAGFETAVEAAAALGVPYPTYAGHENGSSGFRAERGELYARRYRVRFEWLMRGRGPMTEGAAGRGPEIPVVGYLGAGAEVEPDFEQVPPEGLDQIDLPFAMNDDLIAFIVRGPSMLPFYKDGTVIIVYREQKRPLESFYGEEEAVRTRDGRRFIKTIMRGESGVTLTSFNDQPRENVHLEWIGEIFAVLPKSQWKQVSKRREVQGQLRLHAS
jgi:hypothetical protein